jgi:ribosomal-protein-alanine N-acetyltransferase
MLNRAVASRRARSSEYTGAVLLDDVETLPAIHSPRLVLRGLQQSDDAGMFRIFSDPEVMKFWSSAPLTDPAAARALIDEIQRGFLDRKLFQWGVARRSDDAIIGTFTLYQLDRDNRRAEIGFTLAREHWGHGYMTEALTSALDFAFGQVDLTRLEADVDPGNTRSLRLLERLDFVREGLLRERWRVAGGVQDSVMLGLLQREWDLKRSQAGAEPSTAP